MISAEEIKALMAKDENGLLPCAICGMPANINWKVRGMAGSPPEMIIECSDSCERFSKPKPRDYYSFGELYINYKKDEWNTRAHTLALTTLQTLLNQAGEDAQKVIDDYRGLAAVCKANSLLCTYNDALETIAYLEKRLATITPYLTKEGE